MALAMGQTGGCGYGSDLDMDINGNWYDMQGVLPYIYIYIPNTQAASMLDDIMENINMKTVGYADHFAPCLLVWRAPRAKRR